MPFEIRVLPSAGAEILALDRSLHLVIERHLRALADAPNKLTRPSAPPAELPGRQVYGFTFVLKGRLHRITLYVSYGADEQSLYIDAVGHVEYGI